MAQVPQSASPITLPTTAGQPTTYADYAAQHPELQSQIAGLHFDTAHDYRDSKYRKRHPNRPIRVVDPAMM